MQAKLATIPEQDLKLVVAHHPFWLPEQSEYRDVVEHRDYALEAFHLARVDFNA